jgi:5-methylcytosine-specific restriction endonuclease McrA
LVGVAYRLGGKNFWKMYRAYLKSEAWQKKRRKVLIRDKFECKKCGCQDRRKLQVHHKTYDRLFKESLSDLETLCKKCHKKVHEESRKKRGRRRRTRSKRKLRAG